jgi:quinol monooxygenase YgiN
MCEVSVHHRDDAGVPGNDIGGDDSHSLSTCSVDMRFLPKELDHAVQLLLSVKGDILTKRGCRACEVSTDAADEGLIHYHEEWESESAFRDHARSGEFRQILIAMDLSCEEPRIVIGRISGHNGLAYLRRLQEPDPAVPAKSAGGGR